MGKIRLIKLDHPFWGYRRVWAWLKYREGVVVNQKRIRRVMKEQGLIVEVKRYKAKSSKPRAERPKQYWGIDMMKFMIPSLGWAYLVIVLDWYTKKIVGWKVSLKGRTREWKDALDMATLGIEQIFTSYDNPKGNADTERQHDISKLFQYKKCLLLWGALQILINENFLETELYRIFEEKGCAR